MLKQVSKNLLRIICPFYPNGTPGKATTKSSENNIVTLLQSLLPLPQAKWNSCSSGVSIFLNVDHYLVFRQAHAICSRIDDAQIGLMGDQPRDIIRRKIITFHYFRADISHAHYSKLKNSFSFL